MADAESNLFEIERRSILFKSTTTLPDSSTLAYNGDPNLVVSGNSAGQFLLYYSPIGTSYIQDDGTFWDKKQLPNVWVIRGSGTSTESLSAYATISYVNDISSNLQSQIDNIPTYNLSPYTLLTTSESISSNLQSQIDNIPVTDLSNYPTLSYVNDISSNLQIQINNLDSIYATDSSLVAITGNLQTQINNLDLTYATDALVTNISSNLQSQIDGIHNSYSTLTTVQEISSNLDERITLLEAINSNNTESMTISGFGNIVDYFPNTLGDGCEWLVTVKSGNNVRVSKILSAWNLSSNVEFTETSTNDLGDTSHIVFSVVDDANIIKLIANITSGVWEVSIRRTMVNNITSGQVSLDTLQDIDNLKSDVQAISAYSSSLPAYKEEAGLSGWLIQLKYDRNQTICVIGDSTSDNRANANAMYNDWTSRYQNSGDYFDGVTIVSHGENGNTLFNYLNNSPNSGRTITDSIALNAGLYIFSYGINDVRLGNTTQQQLEDRIKIFIERMLTETDGYILLRIPNPLTSDNYNNYNYVSPSNAYQTYTDILRNAYRSFIGKYPRVAVLDVMELIFGTVCTTVANSNGLLGDQLHPSSEGYRRIGRLLAEYCGVKPQPREDLIAGAEITNATYPYLAYPKYLEYRTDLYTKVAQGYYVGMGSTYLDFSFDPNKKHLIRTGDIIKVGDKLTYDMAGATIASGANTRIYSMTFTNYANNNKGIISIYRKTDKLFYSYAFYANNFNGLNIGTFSFGPSIKVASVSSTIEKPVPHVLTFNLVQKISNQSTTIGALTFSANNMSGVFVWDVTNAPSNYFTTGGNSSLQLINTSSDGYTGDVIVNLQITT